MDNAKYKKIIEYISGKITEGEFKPGDRIPSENELAKEFGISRQTVRQALQLLGTQGVLHRVQGKGTFVSQLKAQKDTNVIGVMLTYIDEYIFPEIIKGMDVQIKGTGYSLVLLYTNNSFDKERQCLLYMLENEMSGMLLEPSKTALENPNIDLYNEILHKKIPHVFIHALPPGIDGSYVIEDDEEGGYMAATHLISHGHKNIMGIFKGDDIQGTNRYEGYKRALREAGIKTNEEYVCFFTTEEKDDIKIDKDNLDKCSGVIVYNDEAALQVISKLEKLNRQVPGDLSVVSFDDSRSAKRAGITSVAHPKQILGREAVRALMSLAGGRDEQIKTVMKPLIVERNTVRRIL